MSNVRVRRASRLTAPFLVAFGLSLGISLGAPRPCRAEPPSTEVLQALKERAVTVYKTNSRVVEGKLIGVNPKTIVVVAEDGEVLTVQRADIESIRATPSASASPGSTKPEGQSGAPKPEGGKRAEGGEETGRVRVHIESDDPLVQLFKDRGTAPVPGGIVSVKDLICRAPCDQIVDGRNGQVFFLEKDGRRVGDKFRLHDQSGEVTLRFETLQKRDRERHIGGIIGVSAGSAAVVAGILALAFADPLSNVSRGGDATAGHTVGTVLLLGGAVATGLGGYFLATGRAKYNVDVPQNGPGFTPFVGPIALPGPLTVPGPRGPVGAVLGFSGVF